MVFGRKKHAAAQAPPPPQYQQGGAAAPHAGAGYQPTSAAAPPSAHASNMQTTRQLTRENDRTVMRAQRDMQRERIRLEGEERRIMAEVKTLGRQGRMAEARMLAKNLVQVRNAKARTLQAGMQMSTIGNQGKMAQADAAMINVMGMATGVMQNAGGTMDPQKQMHMVQQFDMETEKYKLTQEMTDEVLDSVLGGNEVDGETDDVLNSVLDEIGLEVAGKGTAAPGIHPQQVRPHQQQQQNQVDMNNDADLMERIAKLGGGAA